MTTTTAPQTGEQRRVYPPKEYEISVLDKLTDIGPGSKVKVFQTKQKALMFAAALGKFRGNREEIEKRGNGIRFDIFENAIDDGFVNALAVAEVGDLKILSPDKQGERIKIFEEYAHAGLKEIEDVCFKKEGDPLVNLVSLIDEARSSSEEIEGVDPGVLAGLLNK